ncbi:MAG: DUF805 domain-containing protein [Pseudomonadota bacterium]
MGFKDSVTTCLRDKYVTFSGRASRSEFWWFMLFLVLYVVVVIALFLVLGGAGAIQSGSADALFSGTLLIVSIAAGLFWLALILPTIAVFVRRFHDVNLSGWWYLACIVATFIPFIGGLISLAPYIVGLFKGTDGENKFGPDPLAEQNPADVFA